MTRGYLRRARRQPALICATYRCRGKETALIQLDSEENFHVRAYTQAEPERLYPVEHSGQLDTTERVQIERKFKDGLVNTLVCTPPRWSSASTSATWWPGLAQRAADAIELRAAGWATLGATAARRLG